VFDEGSRRLFSDDWRVCFVFRQNTAGQFEVVERLLTGHAGISYRNNPGLWLRCNVSGKFALGVEPGTVLGSSYALHAARVGEFAAIRCKPSLTVG
jgi:hypothetical protein